MCLTLCLLGLEVATPRPPSRTICGLAARYRQGAAAALSFFPRHAVQIQGSSIYSFTCLRILFERLGFELQRLEKAQIFSSPLEWRVGRMFIGLIILIGGDCRDHLFLESRGLNLKFLQYFAQLFRLQ